MVRLLEKYKMKLKKGRFLGSFLAPCAASLVQPVISSVVKLISGREEHEENIWTKNFNSTPSFKNYRGY